MNVNPRQKFEMPSIALQLMARVSQLFSFRGRIARQSWLITLILDAIALVVAFAFVCQFVSGELADAVILMLPVPLFFWVLIAAHVKRLHDRGKSGWWLLFCFFPIVGPIWFLYQTTILRGTIGPNTFGSDPT